MHHIYCISGLGADHRIFQKLKIDNAELHFIHWEIPHPDDDMRSYALRLAEQIKHPEIILMGVSFGGMLASEITRIASQATENINLKNHEPNLAFRVKQTILISSCKSRREFPKLMLLAAKIRFHRVVPYRFILRNKTINRVVFDPKSKKEELYLKRLMLQDNELLVIKRSIRIIMEWRNEPVKNLLHIHGTSDRLLSPSNVKADHWIKGGSHFMVWNKAGEISSIINQYLHSKD